MKNLIFLAAMINIINAIPTQEEVAAAHDHFLKGYKQLELVEAGNIDINQAIENVKNDPQAVEFIKINFSNGRKTTDLIDDGVYFVVKSSTVGAP